jgi:ATP-dependent 26S proteasome regulatory subunit
MSRKQLHDVIMKSWKDGNPVDFRQVRERKAKAIEDEYEGIVDFFEPEHGFDEVGGHEHLKKYFLRKIINPLKTGDAKRCSSGVLLTGPPGTGKCLAPGTEILMFDGTIVKVENIKVGDKLMGPDSNPRTVMSLASGRDNMFHVVPTKGSSYTVNEPHILSVRTSGTAKVTNISVSDFLKKPKSWQEKAKGYRSKVVFSTKSVPLDPYFLGLWLGDGDQSDVRITTEDKEVIDFLESLAKEIDQTVSKYEYPERCASYAIVNKAGENVIRTELKNLKVLNNKHIPLLYKANDSTVQRNILAGILDADGSFDKKGKVFDFINKNETLANDVAYIARSLGLAAYVSVCNKTCVNNGVEGTYFRVCISGDLTIIPCKIARKIPTERQSVKNVLNVGIQIVPAGVGDYYGFELDGDKLFLLGDFTVTHNTQIAKALAKEAQMNFMIGNLGKLFGGLVGETEGKTRKFFEAVESAAPVIVFIDEIDSVLSSGRTSHGDSGVAARVFNSVMTFLSDDSRKGKVVVVAASNRPDLLDAALIRSGRFDAKLPALPPQKGDAKGRASVLKALGQKHNLLFSKAMEKTKDDPSNGLGLLLHDKERIWTGAEIEVVIKEALDNAFYADRRDKNGALKETIELEDWNQAMEDIMPNTNEVERMTMLSLLYVDTLAYVPPEWKAVAKDKQALMDTLGITV